MRGSLMVASYRLLPAFESSARAPFRKEKSPSLLAKRGEKTSSSQTTYPPYRSPLLPPGSGGICGRTPRRLAAAVEQGSHGEGGIRTLGTRGYTRFPVVHLQPLGHLSLSIVTLERSRGGGIRTPGTETAHVISSHAPSTTRPPLLKRVRRLLSQVSKEVFKQGRAFSSADTLFDHNLMVESRVLKQGIE